MNIIIIGGKGFIGSHIANTLKNDHNITIIDGWTTLYPGFTSIHRGNKGLQPVSELEKKHRIGAYKYRQSLINQIECIEKWTFNDISMSIFINPDLIINCGGLCEAILSQYLEDFTYSSTVISIKNINKFFNCPIIHMSSSMVYGTWLGTIKENYRLKPVDWYGTCKVMAEKLLDIEKDIILRPMHVYGYGDGSFPITMNIERQLEINKPVNVEEADCIYIKDFTNLIKIITNNPIAGIYNVSAGYLRNTNTLKNCIKKILQVDIETNKKLGPTGKSRGKLNNEKIKNMFKWKLLYNTYEESILDYLGDYENLR